MSSYNKCIIMGNLTRDVNVKQTQGGSPVAELGIVLNRSWQDKTTNAKREEATFVDVTLFGRDAEIAAQYLAKGKPVLIEGRLHLDAWDDRQTGQKRTKLKVIAERLTLLGEAKPQGPPAASHAGAGRRFASTKPVSADDGPPVGFDDQEHVPAAPAAQARREPAGPPPDDEVPF